MSTSFEAVHGTVADLIAEVQSWPGIESGDHRFGGTAFRLGGREVGHVHGWGMLDIAFARPLRDALVTARATQGHHLLTDSGWTTFYIRSTDDYDHARWLLRLSYLYHATVSQQAGEEALSVDVDAELDGLALDESVRAAFERRQPATA